MSVKIKTTNMIKKLQQKFNKMTVIQTDNQNLNRGKSLYLLPFMCLLLMTCFTASAQNALVPFNFKVGAAGKTSAGIFKKDGTLVRTLWNNVSYNAGTFKGNWDRKDDEGKLVTDTGFVVKVVCANVNYKWEGVIGNTSDSLTGSTVIRMFDRMHTMAIAGNFAYYGAGYTEGVTSSYKFNVTDPQKKYNILYSEVSDMAQTTEYVATDSINVYWAGYDPFDDNKKSFVYATKVGSDKEVMLTRGSAVEVTHGRTYEKAINIATGVKALPKGLAVQKKGIYLFVSHTGTNKLDVLNKTTGALVTSITVSAPRDLAVDKNDNLWMISGTNLVQKYTVNSNGTLSAAVLSIIGLVKPLALGISSDNKNIVIIDGGSSQQVKAFSNSTGTASWTLGQKGGYETDPAVTNDKFYFSDDATMLSNPFIAFQADGSFWVGDVGNERVQHYNASRVFIDRIMSLPHSYSVSVDRNDPTRVFNEYLEFKVDYSKPLAANNGSWTLVRNWRRGVTKDYFQEGMMRIFTQVITLSNGRTYATLENSKIPDERYPEIVEMPASGNLRYTGVKFDVDAKDFIETDGTRRRYISSGHIGEGGYWESQKLTGFSNNNPVWGSSSRIADLPTIAENDPASGYVTDAVITTSDILVVFDHEEYNTGYHLGAVKKGDNKYLWKTSPSTTYDYAGPYPTDGAYDIGNNVEYGGSHAFALDRNIFWNYRGEFWKNSQTNMWNHFYDNGLMVGQFGTITPDVDKITPEAYPMGAGNVFSSVIVKVGSDYYIYHNDESVHAGVHRWKISGLNTISEQVIPIYPPKIVSGGLMGNYFNGTDLNNINLKVSVLNPTVNLVLTALPTQISNKASFSTRWTGFVKPAFSQDYTFYTKTGKGVKLWIDGKLLIDQWSNKAAKEFAGYTISLQANKLYSVRMEINGGTASLSWSSAGRSKQVIPAANLFPSDVPIYEEGVDLLEGLYGKSVLINNSYGWKRNSVDEDSTSSEQFWHVRTGIKSFNNNKTDLNMNFRREDGENEVTRDLGLSSNGYSAWKVYGTIDFEGNSPKWNDDIGGAYFDILDDQGKVITRFTHEQKWTTEMTHQINFNGEELMDKNEKYLYAMISKYQPFEINATSNGVVLQYAGYTSSNVGIYDAASHWDKPTTIRFHFIGSTTTYDRMINVGRLAFSGTAKSTAKREAATQENVNDSNAQPAAMETMANAGRQLECTVFPNPFAGEIHVAFTNTDAENAASVVVMDVQGRLILSSVYPLHDGENEITLDGSSYASGIYFVKIMAGRRSLVVKMEK
jgi:hypothetical protein